MLFISNMANIFPRILKNVRFQLFLNKRILIIYNDFGKKRREQILQKFFPTYTITRSCTEWYKIILIFVMAIFESFWFEFFGLRKDLGIFVNVI